MSAAELFMFFGFVVAAYSIVANDAIQTLGTFLSFDNLRWVCFSFDSVSLR